MYSQLGYVPISYGLKRVAWAISTCEGQANGGISWIFNRLIAFHEKLWVLKFCSHVIEQYRNLQNDMTSNGDKEWLSCGEAQTWQGVQKMIVEFVCTTRLGKPVTSIIEQNCSGLLLWPPWITRLVDFKSIRLKETLALLQSGWIELFSDIHYHWRHMKTVICFFDRKIIRPASF